MSSSFYNHPATTEIYTLSLHDALPILGVTMDDCVALARSAGKRIADELQVPVRSEEHTSELQSLRHLVCRLLLEKKNQRYKFSPGCKRPIRLSSDARLQKITQPFQSRG